MLAVTAVDLDRREQVQLTAVVTAVPFGATSAWTPWRSELSTSPRISNIGDDITVVDGLASDGGYGFEIVHCLPHLGMERCIFAFHGVPDMGMHPPHWDAARSAIRFGDWIIAVIGIPDSRP